MLKYDNGNKVEIITTYLGILSYNLTPLGS